MKAETSMGHRDITMRTASSFILRPSSFRVRGFTLIEMLIVCAIITMVVLIAIPAFKSLTGGRSTEAAANNLAALLGRARSEAIGLQRTTGILFYMDQATDRVAAVIVREVEPPLGTATTAGLIFLDLAPNAEFTLLPPGVGLQTLDNAAFSTSTGLRTDDGYLGFNEVYTSTDFTAPMAGLPAGLVTRVGGAILFDGVGRLSVRPYRLLLNDGSSTNTVEATTELAKLLASKRDYTIATPQTGKTCTGTAIEMSSSVGFVLYDLYDFRDASTAKTEPRHGSAVQTFTTNDNDGDGSGSLASMRTGENGEELWLDQNATPFIVARSSGGLLRNR
jgi:prepilin-type N-terminal cleavage/methylation domain-containing protein